MSHAVPPNSVPDAEFKLFDVFYLEVDDISYAE